MSNLVDFTQKRNEVSTETLSTFSRLVDAAISYIIHRPHISNHEIIGFFCERVGRLISVMPHRQRVELLEVAIDTVQKYSKKQ